MADIPGLHIDPGAAVPVYRQIADAVVAAIRDGRLRSGERLPATRDLARRLGVNRNTAVAAYDALVADGAVTSHTGRGTFVTQPPRSHGSDAGAISPTHVATGSETWATSFARAVEGPGFERLMTIYRATLATAGYSFAGAYPDPQSMPVDALREALAAVLRDEPERALAYGPTVGDPGLRELLAESMRRRGSTVDAANLVITSGAQQGLDLVFRALLDRGDVALVEDPTYTGALSVLGSIGARVVGLPSDDRGLRTDTLREALERYRPRLLYVQPTFQNPTTREMDEDRRREVLDLARAFRCPVVEDDWAGELRFDGDDVPNMHALDDANVVYLSSFSKKLMPGIRIGWVAAPAEAARRLEGLKQVADFGTSPLLQAALHRFLAAGHLEHHLARVRRTYRTRRDAMLAALAREFPAGVAWTRPRGGLFVWVTLPPGTDADTLSVDAQGAGVSFSRGSLFHVEGRGHNTMRLAFAASPPDRIDAGVEILGGIARRKIEEAGAAPPGRLEETLPVL